MTDLNQTQSKQAPTVSIGMPVYNGDKVIREAIESLLAQTFKDFELIISDNASTDSTEAICREYEKKDFRVRYIRQAVNQGAIANFKYVLNEALGEYFMWAACDDLRSVDFLHANLNFLKSNPDYISSTSPVKFCGGNFNEIKMGDSSLDSENRHDRIVAVFKKWHANGRFYSLFRRKPLLGWKHIDSSFLGSDWSLITHLANQGKLKRVAEGWVELGNKGVSNSTDIFAQYRTGRLDWIFPFNKLSLDTWKYMKEAGLTHKAILLFRLLYLNYKAFRLQFHVMRHRKNV